MNKKLIIILVLFGLFLFTGCEKKLNYEKHLINLSYSYGDKTSGYIDYNIIVDGDEISYKVYGTLSKSKYITKEIDKTYIDKINKIIEKYDVLDWDGFNKHKDKESDEIVFSIHLGYDDGSNYSASGYMSYPDNFKTVHKELLKLFDSLNY